MSGTRLVADADFAAPVALDAIGRLANPVMLEADDAQRLTLACRFGLVQLDQLAASLTLTRKNQEVNVTGTVTAQLSQACVVTAEPVDASVSENIALRLVPAEQLEAAEEAAEIELESGALDILGHDGRAIDLGAIIADTLVLALDPYPRSPGADAALKAAGVKSEEEAGAFGALAALRESLARSGE